jgi:hypothetical protein
MTFSNDTYKPTPFKSERTITKFALFPITIDGITKWLEKVTIRQQYQASGAADISFIGWVNVKFIDKG